MQTDSGRASPLDLLSAVAASLGGGGGGGFASFSDDASAEHRRLIAVLTTAVAVLVGCVAIFFFRRSSGKKPLELPKPLEVKTRLDAEEDQGKQKVTVFFGTQTGTAEGLAKVASALSKSGWEMMISVLRMTFSAWRELLWPELDKFLQDENDTGTSSPYTAAVPEYQVVFLKPEEVPSLDKSLSFVNGHAFHDLQHPCRANVVVRRELHTPASDRSCIHLEFDIAGTGLTYGTGDHVGVFCRELF